MYEEEKVVSEETVEEVTPVEAAEEVFEDETIVCAQCKAEFVFSAGEKKFYKEKGLLNKPKYCKECRAARKGAAPKPERPEREMFTAICSECGAEAKVPFQPNPDKPVYCDACFKAKRGL